MPEPVSQQAAKVNFTPMGRIIDKIPAELSEAIEASKTGNPVWAHWNARAWCILIHMKNPRVTYQVFPNHLQAYREGGGVEPTVE